MNLLYSIKCFKISFYSLLIHISFSSFRPDCFISSETDTYITSKPYETYEEMMKRLDYDGKARIIQKNYKIYKLWKYVKQYAREYRELAKQCRFYEAENILLYRCVISKNL